MSARPRVILERVGFDSLGVKNSVTLDPSDNFIELQGDSATPGNNKYYGTNVSGNKGWQSTAGFLNDVPGSNDDILQKKSGSWTNRSVSQYKADLAITNVDNTSDANKPISTATQAALDAKLSLTGGTMSGAIAMGSTKVTGLANGTTASDAVNKSQLDAEATARAAADTTLQNNINAIGTFPAGVIVMWSGTTAPSGWALCNGSGGTPDLRGKFIVGYNPADADYDAIGDNGGAKTVTLSLTEIPSHTHGLTNVTNGATHSFNTGTNWSTRLAGTTDTTGSAGGGAAHENRPPFFTLAYIIKT